MRTSTIAASRLVAILASRLCDVAFYGASRLVHIIVLQTFQGWRPQRMCLLRTAASCITLWLEVHDFSAECLLAGAYSAWACSWPHASGVLRLFERGVTVTLLVMQ